MYFLGTAELLSAEILITFHLRLRSLSVLGGYFVQLFVLWGHFFCLLSGDRRLLITWRLKMYYFYGKINWGHVVCPLYRGGWYHRESVTDAYIFFISLASYIVCTPSSPLLFTMLNFVYMYMYVYTLVSV